ncbi:Putative alpha/Beta hydrolase [Septoria linicola]|uniref:Alpha/Beta hydrolase n=1 Tax=Septoria linicola TaxID=215465 RepID=A0A9Q9AYQ4_9PEZI|nr:putative alpha/Beta hydrolase [Septoria linicola]USW54493.1 Putative alpha/Beta hydrolase [Septoria linicola]
MPDSRDAPTTEKPPVSEATPAVAATTATVEDDDTLRELKRVHTNGSEQPDEPKAQPPEADEFGLPVKPPRRRNYSLDELDSPDQIKQQVIEETGGDVEGQTKVKETADPAPTTVLESLTSKDADQARANDGPSTPRTSTDGRPLEQVDTNSSAKAAPTSLTSVRAPGSPSASRHAAKPSVTSIGEFSHQQVVPRKSADEVKEEEEEDAWQEMPAVATHRIYDDWGKVLAKGYDEVEDETVAYGTLGGAGKGYTRVQMDEDAKSATSMDDNTAYLFKDQYARNNVLQDEDEGEAMDAMGQLQATKELLTEGQRVAYVGVVRLALAEMQKDFDQLERNKGTRKLVELAGEALKMWSQKVMIRLYSHMEIDAREQIMVEQLAEHGVLPSDLTPALMASARVKNPTAGSEPASQVTSARPSMASPRPSNFAEKQLSSANNSAPPSKPGTPQPQEIDSPPPTYAEHTADQLTIENPDDYEDAKNLDIDIRWTVLCDLFLLLIADSMYDARSRVLLERVGAGLSVHWQEICRFEKRVTDALEMQEEAEKENWNEQDHIEARRKAAKKKRMVVMGLCTVGGGLVIGLSAGLLAPVIGAGLAAGFTAVGVSGTGTFLGGTGAAALIGTTGTLLGGKIGFGTSGRRTGAVKTFEYKPLYNNKRVNLIVTVAGWMTGTVDDVRLPFSTVDPIMGDIYSVNWEPDMLRSTGQTMQILGTEALTQTIQQILGATFLTTLMAGLSTPMILAKISYLIDNPWSVSCARADAAGLILADSIIERNLGVRPVTLVGFSLGARVVYACLKELARRGGIGLVQNVYVFGSPVVVKKDDWIKAKSVVPGRFVNGYATNDWILGYLFRATGGGVMRIAGLASVDIAGIENIDVTEDVPGHMAYRAMMPTLLDKVGWAVESLEYTEIEDPDPENHEKRQRELINEIEEARRQLEEQPEKKGFKSFFTRKKAPQKKAWETYDERNAKVLEGDEKEAEKLAEENANVMFDVEAIRREALALAVQRPGDIDEIKKHLSVRELQSTLPALKVDLSKHEGGSGGSTPSSASRPSFAHAHSRSCDGTSSLKSPPLTANGSKRTEDDAEGEISMTFDSPEQSRTTTLNTHNSDHGGSAPTSRYATPDPHASSSCKASPSPQRPETAWDQQLRPKHGVADRPTLRSVTSPLPSGSNNHVTSPVVTSPDYNPWGAGADADDPEFGQEREVKMTF